MSTDYELKRLENIKRNQEILKELGLHSANLPQFTHQSGREQGAKTAKVLVVNKEKQPRRRSARTDRLPRVEYKIEKLEPTSQISPENFVDFVDAKTARKERLLARTRGPLLSLPYVSPLPKKSSATPYQNPSSTRTQMANLDNFLAKPHTQLGNPLEQFGKAAVIALASDLASSPVSFNKYSGITEWQNALFLWVNLSPPTSESKQTDYQNVLLDDNTCILWFGGSKMYPESPVIQRILDNNESDHIMMFARFEGQPYFCLGRVAAKSVDLQARPLAFQWKFLDHKHIVKTESFQAMIAMQAS